MPPDMACWVASVESRVGTEERVVKNCVRMRYNYVTKTHSIEKRIHGHMYLIVVTTAPGAAGLYGLSFQLQAIEPPKA
jgi:hypothetical protein